MIILVYYIKNKNTEAEVFDPFSILGLAPRAAESAVKKKYRRLSIQYHPDKKNPDPEAHEYFVGHIAKSWTSSQKLLNTWKFQFRGPMMNLFKSFLCW